MLRAGGMESCPAARSGEVRVDVTILLSRALGPFILIASIAMLLRRQYFAAVIAEFAQARLLRLMLALIELLAGLFLVLLHNDWSSVHAGIISAIGWLAILEGVSYLLLPDRKVAAIIGWFNRPNWYIGGGLFGIVVGAWLSLAGFGYI